MKMTYLYRDSEGRVVVTVDQELFTELTPQSCLSLKPNEELRLHTHILKFREIYPKYQKIKEHFSKFFAALMEN